MILPARLTLALPWPAHRPPLGRPTVFQLIVFVWREANRSDFGRWIRCYGPVDPRSALARSPRWPRRMGGALCRPSSCVAFLFLPGPPGSVGYAPERGSAPTRTCFFRARISLRRFFRARIMHLNILLRIIWFLFVQKYRIPKIRPN